MAAIVHVVSVTTRVSITKSHLVMQLSSGRAKHCQRQAELSTRAARQLDDSLVGVTLDGERAHDGDSDACGSLGTVPNNATKRLKMLHRRVSATK